MKIAPLEAVRNRRVEGKAAARGVSKSSRRRLPWPLVQGMMLMHRANLREATLATWARTQSARAKLRDSLWRAWVCRSLKIAGPHNSLSCGMNGEDQLCPIRGKLLEPLSRRDLWVLKRASALAGRIPQLTNRSDPDPDFDRQVRRHVLDWLHVPRGLVWAASWETRCSHRAPAPH